MSTEENQSLHTLPPELIYRIFELLDTPTIIRSVRPVCKRLYSMVNEYKRYILNFQSILRSDFIFIYNLIRAKNVASLTLSDDDETPGQIEHFLSLFRMKQFTGLHSLKLLEIDDCYLNIILKDLPMLRLNSLTIHSERDFSQNSTTLEHFQSTMSVRSLNKLIWNIPGYDGSKIGWPLGCTIQHLEIHCRTLNEFYNIVNYLPNLRILLVEELNTTNVDPTMLMSSNLEPFRQLYSLTFKNGSIDMSVLELLLSFSLSLEHLKLIRCVDLHAFVSYLQKWQIFIEKNLHLLRKFDFFLVDSQIDDSNTSTSESIITPFRAPFWTETKKWFAMCDHITRPRTFILYSPSAFDPKFNYTYISKQVFRSTSIPTINKTIIMDGVHKMYLHLTDAMASITSSQGGLPTVPVFPKLDELSLHVDDQWPLGSLRFLSSLIDLSHVTKFSFIHNSPYSNNIELQRNISTLVKLMHNLRSFSIFIRQMFMFVNNYNMEICSIIPAHVKHVTLPVSSLYQMQMALSLLGNRSSIKFQFRNIDLTASEIHIAWLQQETGYYTFRLSDSSLCMWLNKKIKDT